MNRLPAHSLYLQVLRASLVVGALSDFALAGVLLIAPTWLVATADTTAALLVLRLLSVALAGSAVISWLGAYDAVSYAGNIATVVTARALASGILWIGASAVTAGMPLACFELVLAGVGGWALFSIRR